MSPSCLARLPVVAFVLWWPPASAVAAEAACLDFVPAAERHYHLPAGLLAAVALTESGVAGAPQPYALNVAGSALLPPTRQAAARLLRGADGKPRRDVAVGCMQLHMRYHLDRLGTPERALDPRLNVWYGAALLARLRQQYGSWPAAIGHYNAADPVQRRRYLCEVARQLMTTAPADGHAVTTHFCGSEKENPARGLHASARVTLMALRRVGKIIVVTVDPRMARRGADQGLSSPVQ